MESLAMKALKYLVVTVLTIVVLAILTLVGVALFVNPNHFKTQIANAVDKITGRQLTINGNIRWSFFPWLGLGVQDVSLSNASDFGQTPFATLGEVDVSVKFLPLLHGAIEVGTVKLTNLQINLVRQARGKTNWDDLLTHTATGTMPVASQANIPAQGPTVNNQSVVQVKPKNTQFIINQVIINNAVIHWQDAKKQVQKTLIIDKLCILRFDLHY